MAAGIFHDTCCYRRQHSLCRIGIFTQWLLCVYGLIFHTRYRESAAARTAGWRQRTERDLQVHIGSGLPKSDLSFQLLLGGRNL